jgi:transposase
MAARVELREIRNEEGNRLLGMVRRSSGSVVTWRRAQIVLLAAQRMPPVRIAEVVFTDPDTVRDVIHNFNRDGFEALYPRYKGGRPRRFTLPERQQIKRIALSVPSDLGQPFATWSLAKLADYLVAEEVVTDISHEGLRQLLREEGVSFQALRTGKRSNDPEFEAKKNRILELYAIAHRQAKPGPGDPSVVICIDEFGHLQPQPGGKAWAPRAKPRRIRATYTRPHGVRHLLCTLDVADDLLTGKATERKPRRVPRRLRRDPRPLPIRHQDRPRSRQLLAAQRRPGQSLGRRQQRRARLHTPLRLLAQPDRASVQTSPLLLPRRHRPPQPRHPKPAHRRLHRLAQRPPRRPQTQTPHQTRTRTQGRRPHRHGKRCLTIH